MKLTTPMLKLVSAQRMLYNYFIKMISVLSRMLFNDIRNTQKSHTVGMTLYHSCNTINILILCKKKKKNKKK